jgi:TrmH family RNA methyltransferase
MIQRITSRENEAVKRVCKLRDSAAARAEAKCFFAEGLRLCADLVQVLPLQEVYYTQTALERWPHIAQWPGAHVLVSDSVAQKLAATQTPQGVFGVFEGRHSSLQDIAAGEHWLLLEHVQDPANVGALLRSAAAFGYNGVALCAHCADPYSPKAVRASMSCVGRLKLVVCESVQDAAAALRQVDIPLVAAALQRSVPLDEAPSADARGVALLVGNEGNGLTAAALDLADTVVRIPMAAGVESLNAAAAGSVLLWHFRGGKQ